MRTGFRFFLFARVAYDSIEHYFTNVIERKGIMKDFRVYQVFCLVSMFYFSACFSKPTEFEEADDMQIEVEELSDSIATRSVQGRIINLENEADLGKIINSNSYVIVDFYSSGCGPCRSMSAVLDRVIPTVSDVVVVKVNTGKFGPLSRKYGVRSIPHLFFYNNGTRVYEVRGAQSDTQLRALIKKYF